MNDRGESLQRVAVVDAARRWIATRYHQQADVIGSGVDCGMILVRVFVDTGLIAHFDPRPYPDDWMMHSNDERYLQIVQRCAACEFDPREIPPKAGDVVVWQYGRTFSHGAIVTGQPGTYSGWPWVVHAYLDSEVVEEIDLTGSPMMRIGVKPRPIRAFSYWPAAA